MAGPLALIILDGFGEAPPAPDNAISQADPRFLMELRQDYPSTLLDCSGEDVGLPCGLMGNSEVGHLNIGAGRIVYQEISRIDQAIADRSFFVNDALRGAVDHAVTSGGRLHLMGLVSDGGVHSSDAHVDALLALCAEAGLVGDRVLLHAFLDGRDTPPRSARKYIRAVEAQMAAKGVGRIATLCGRYFAMDRDKRWERTQLAYRAIVAGEGAVFENPIAAIEASYAADKGDEFLAPAIIGTTDSARIHDGDAAIFFNFRTDRTRQLTEALTFAEGAFTGFSRGATPNLHLATMTRYREDFACPVGFKPKHVRGILPQIVSEAGLSQLRIAETEKYAHVTFFISGGDEKEFAGERRILVPSPKVATYDLQPSMSAPTVTEKLLETLDGGAPDLTILNFANADMVGHTGIVPAAVEAVKTIDECLSRIVPRYLAAGGNVAITADHGNCEMMVDPATGEPHTAHTINPVPLIVAGADVKGRNLKSGGRLCDIATTLLPLMGLSAHPEMTGVNLL